MTSPPARLGIFDICCASDRGWLKHTTGDLWANSYDAQNDGISFTGLRGRLGSIIHGCAKYFIATAKYSDDRNDSTPRAHNGKASNCRRGFASNPGSFKAQKPDQVRGPPSIRCSPIIKSVITEAAHQWNFWSRGTRSWWTHGLGVAVRRTPQRTSHATCQHVSQFLTWQVRPEGRRGISRV